MASKSSEKMMWLSTGKTESGKDTGHFYTNKINKKNIAEKGEDRDRSKGLMKFDPRAYNEKTGKPGKKVLYKRKKLPK